ncbi:MAG: outer membrane beta-barrel protein [Bacteroidota bacterium]
MKKLLTILFVIIFLFGMSAIDQTATAQTQEGDFKVGAGLVFGSGVGFGSLDNDLGIRVDGYYAFTPEIRGGGDFTFYFPKSEGETDATVWELNFNGNYIFIDEDGLLVYALGGINITGLNLESSVTNEFGTFGGETSDTEIGLNLGGGLEYALDFADFFAEAKLGNLGGNADQFVLGAGLRFPF